MCMRAAIFADIIVAESEMGTKQHKLLLFGAEAGFVLSFLD